MARMNYNRSGGAGSLSLASMFSAFALLFLFLASVLPGVQMVMFFLSSIFVMGIMLEGKTGFALLSFMVVSLLGFFILPDKTLLIPYALFFGHYGIGKYLIEKKLRKKTSAMIAKFIYFNAALAGMYFFARSLLFSQLPFELPIVVFFILMQVIFVFYDFLFSKVTLFYDDKIRRMLKGSYY